MVLLLAEIVTELFLLIEMMSNSISSLIIYAATQLALMIFCSIKITRKWLIKEAEN